MFTNEDSHLRRLSMSQTSPPRSGQANRFRSYSGSSLATHQSTEDYHHARLGEYAASLWRQNAMTDVMVVVRDKEFKCHRAVLACYSPYFKEVLLKPGSNNVHYLEIPCVTPEAFEILLNFMYTGEMKLTCQNLSDVYRASRRLNMQDALNKCRELLSISGHNMENTIYLFVTSKKLNLLDPCVRAFKLMLHNFEYLVRTNEFLELEVDQLVDLFKADIIGTRSEVNVYIAALNWINAKYLDREMYIDQVMSCIRFPLMNLTEILLCHHPPLLPAIVLFPKVHVMIFEATCYVAAKHMGQESIFKELSCTPRMYLLEEEPPLLWEHQNLYDPDLYPEYRDREAATKIQAAFRGYRTRKKVYIDYRRQSVAATAIQAAFRGYMVRKSLRNQKRFIIQLKEGEWQRPYSRQRYRSWDDSTEDEKYGNKYSDQRKKPFPNDLPSESSHLTESDFAIPSKPSISNISDLTKECLDNVVYAIGSADIVKDYTCPNAVLCFSPSANVWKEIGSLPEPRSDIRIALVGDILYCIGGCNPRIANSGKILPTRDCFKYYVNVRQWENMAPLRVARVFHGVGVLGQFVFAVGGKDDKSRILASMERYDTMSNKWVESAPMGTPRMGMGVTAYEDMIWVAGGMTGHGDKLVLIDIVESYDFKTGRWDRKVKMPHPIAFMALVQCRDKLYSIGGALLESSDRRELTSVTDVYTYDIKNDFWRMSAGLPNPWHSVVASGLGDEIYVLGGHSSQNYAWLKEVFYYDSVLRRWRPSCFLPTSASGRIIAAVGSNPVYQ